MKHSFGAIVAICTITRFLSCEPIHAQGVPKPAATAAAQLDELQGTWEGAEAGRGGNGKGKVTLTVSGKSIEFRGADKREWYRATFTLPAGTEPNQLHGTITESPLAEFVGKTGISIYKLENGTLTLTGRQPGSSEVPKKFEGEPETRTFVLKKAAVKEE